MSHSARAASIGLGVTVVLVAAAVAVPPLFDWQVWPRVHVGDGTFAPLHGFPQVKVGIGTVPAVLLALASWRWAEAVVQRLSWRRLLLLAYAAGLIWLLSLALVDGTDGISRVLGSPSEYLVTARSVDDVPELLRTYVSRIPFSAPDGNWPIHIAGHPPGMVLFFVLLVKLGLGGDLVAGLVVIVIAATIPLAVMMTVRVLGTEDAARTAAPFLVLTPSAVFLAVSADAVMAATVAWGMACLAHASRGIRRDVLAGLPAGNGQERPVVSGTLAWVAAAAGGLLLGCGVFMSYGLPLTGVLAIAVIGLGGGWRVLPVAVVAGIAVALAFAVGGFAW